MNPYAIWFLAAMKLLVPNKDHTVAANLFAKVMVEDKPLFKDDADYHKTMSLMTVISFRESTISNAAVSKTHDYCYFQINQRPDLLENPEECVRTGIKMLRESMRICPKYPIAFYAEGPRGCESLRAQKISTDRMNLAFWVEKHVKVDPIPVD